MDDHTPWWLWADRWKGDFAYEEETQATGFVEASTAVSGNLVLDHREVEGCTVTWVGKQSNTATIDSRAVGGMDEQNEVTRLHGSSSSSLKGSFRLSPRSGLVISMERDAYKVSLSTAAGETVKGSSSMTAGVDMSGYSQETGWEDGGQSEIGFAQEGSKKIPENRGPIEDRVGEQQGASDASYQSELRWVLEPEHDVEMWVYRYTGMLESNWKRFVEQQQATLARCEAGEFEGTPCRAARANLERSDERVARLADDCRRILEKLLRAECPGFARGMRRTISAWSFEQAVCSSPATTCDVIHRHVWDHLDSTRTGDDIVHYNALPNHLHCLYTFDEFKNVALYSGVDFTSQALPH